MKKISIKHITNLNKDSLRGLDFYEQELKILQERLDEISADNTGAEVAEKVEHFQNQFIIHQNAIRQLRSHIHDNIRIMESQIIAMDGYVYEDSATEDENLYEDYLTEEKLFNELRHEFNLFAAQWM